MKKRAMGTHQLQLPLLGLGCMGMSECYGQTNDQASIKTIHRAIELGMTHFDTADCYGCGHNERLLSRALQGYRDQITLASKCGLVRDPASGEFLHVNGTAEYIKQCCDDSLKRLQVDYIDLFYLHRADPTIPIEVSITALAELVSAGKVRHIGLSEVCAATISRAQRIFPLTAIQSEYSLWHREPEKEIIPLCQQLNIGFIAHGPIGKGFLSGTIHSVHQLTDNDLRRILPRFQDEHITHNLSILPVLESIAANKNATLTQIALAWVLAQGDHIVAIPGTKHIDHLEENGRATELTLSQEEVLQISNRIPIGFAQGALLPESFAKFSNH